MKYYTTKMFERDIHVFEADPNDGTLVAHHENSLSKVEDINHNWFEDRPYWHKVAAINCSFFNSDGSRNGSSMEDTNWKINPWANDPWIEMIWDGNMLTVRDLNTIDLATLKANIVKGVKPLLQNGQKDVRKDQVSSYAPRTSFGQKADGDIVFMVTDGREAGGYLSFDQTCEVMLNLGCLNAVMLDGGGSSTMCINNEMVNNNENRMVYDALIFYSKQELVVEDFKNTGEEAYIKTIVEQSQKIETLTAERDKYKGMVDKIKLLLSE